MGRWRLGIVAVLSLALGLPTAAKPQSDPRQLLRQYQYLLREGHCAEAEALLRHLTAYHGDELAVRVAVARHAMRSGDWDYAQALLADALRVDGQCMEARMARAEMLRQQNRLSEAMQELETALRLAPRHELADRVAGLLRLMQGQWEAAIVHLTRHLNRTDEPDADAYCWRGLAWLRSGRFAQAEADFARAWQLEPDLAEIHLYRAQALEGQGKAEEAAAAYARYLAKNPQHAEARLALAKLFQQLRRPDDVARELRVIAQQHSGQRDTLRTVYQMARQLRQYYLALEVLEHLLALEPNEVDLWFQKALLLDLLNRDREVLAALDECEKRIGKAGVPNRVVQLSANFYVVRANAYRKLGQLEEALQAVNKALELNRQYGYAYYVQADVYWRMGKVQAALAALDTAEGINAQYANIYIKRAQILQAQGKWTEALKELDRAAQLPGTTNFVSMQRGVLLVILGRWEEACKELLRVQRDERDHPSAFVYSQTVALALQGDWQRAERFAEEHLAENPTDPLSTYNLACAWALLAEIAMRKAGMAPTDATVLLYKRRALALLEKTFQLGYRDRWHAVHDPDLLCLHREPAFWQIVGAGRPFTEP